MSENNEKFGFLDNKIDLIDNSIIRIINNAKNTVFIDWSNRKEIRLLVK